MFREEQGSYGWGSMNNICGTKHYIIPECNDFFHLLLFLLLQGGSCNGTGMMNSSLVYGMVDGLVLIALLLSALIA